MGGPRILITGGAGFIGSHLADYRVGDFRHGFACAFAARTGRSPRTGVREGIGPLHAWIEEDAGRAQRAPAATGGAP